MGRSARQVPGLALRPATVVLTAALAALTACTTGGPPPVVSQEVAGTTTAPPPASNELVIGVDDLGPGFNPHTLADLGPVSLGVAGLVLPSTFREDGSGALRLDPTLVESAEVTDQQPFTVTYQLRREASWSDGAPIAAEDFAYLVERMKAEPGTANPTGYRLVQRVNSGSGGKRVDVVFDRPYPGWRTMFGNLLPAHLFKDAPGGWTQAMDGGLPVSGGPFAMRAVDAARGMVVLERNDRYWEVPAVLDRLVLREADASDLVSALATGGDQLAVMRADGIAMALLRANAPWLPVRTVPEPVAAELLLRPSSPDLADARVRAAVASALDVSDLVAVGSGNGPAAGFATAARTLLPSQPGYLPTLPQDLAVTAAGAADPLAAAAQLTAAGFERLPVPGSTVSWVRTGRPLNLVVAAPAERPDYVAIATRVVRQLAAAGIDAELVTPSGDELFAGLTDPLRAGGSGGSDGTGPARPEPSPEPRPQLRPADAPMDATRPGVPGGTAAGVVPDPGTADGAAVGGPPTTTIPTTTIPTTTTPAAPEPPGLGDIDLAVVPRPVSGDPAADLASWYACPDLDGPVAGRGPSQAYEDDENLVPENPVGYCDPVLRAVMDDLLTGASPVGEALVPTEDAVWRDLPSIPLYQHAVVMVTGKGVTGLEPGGLLAGVFAAAPRWQRPTR
jgi:ABC-type transport system substrate-binding protein